MNRRFIAVLALGLLVACGDDATAPNGPSAPTPTVFQWALYPGNPVMAPAATAWDSGMVSDPAVVMFRDTLRMWYIGSATPQYNGPAHIGYAWSLNGTTWNRHSAPVLLAPAAGWDSPQLSVPMVMVDGDTLRLWYGGGSIRGSGLRVGYAVSVDGVQWDRHATPVITGNQVWNAGGVIPGGVVREGGVYKMWFSGGVGALVNPPNDAKWSVGLATSPDGVHWTLSANPVLESGSFFDQNFALSGTVRKTSAGYEMWYTGSRRNGGASVASIGYATSSDGIAWTKHGSVLSSPSATGSFGNAFYTPQVVVVGTTYRMWVSAWHPGPRIGYATPKE